MILVHLPPQQDSPEKHVRPHPPQLELSEEVSTQVSPQRILPAAQDTSGPLGGSTTAGLSCTPKSEAKNPQMVERISAGGAEEVPGVAVLFFAGDRIDPWDAGDGISAGNPSAGGLTSVAYPMV